jgi:predicted 2-oxoglutarate/Fe(II)-dependent dioxygenase YbiX
VVLDAFAKASASKGATVYVDPAFLDAAGCLRIRRAMDAGERESADVLHDSIEWRDDVRRAAYIDVSDEILLDLETRLDARRDAIGAFFDLRLVALEGAGFVRYPDGGFYLPHRDRATLPSWPDAARRAIAAVVFLNSSLEADARGDFSGGLLRLLEDPVEELTPRQGTLVAFPADRLHEVTIVRGGARDAVVDWFY